MLLQDFVTRYCLRHDLSDATERHYRHVSSAFCSWHVTPFRTHDFEPDLLNEYLVYLRELGRSPFTQRQRRTSLLVLWRDAHRQDLAPPVRTDDVRHIRCPDPPKDTWTPEEVGRLVRACDTLSGYIHHCGLPRREYFRTLILAAYETGLRRGDLHQIERSWIAPGVFAVCQSKTGRQVVVRLTDATLAEILAFAGSRAIIWPAPSRKTGSFARTFRQVVQAAGLDGTFGKLRKSSGTEVERLQSGAGWLHLGHTTPDTARRWYLDPTRAYGQDLPVPRID